MTLELTSRKPVWFGSGLKPHCGSGFVSISIEYMPPAYTPHTIHTHIQEHTRAPILHTHTIHTLPISRVHLHIFPYYTHHTTAPPPPPCAVHTYLPTSLSYTRCLSKSGGSHMIHLVQLLTAHLQRLVLKMCSGCVGGYGWTSWVWGSWKLFLIHTVSVQVFHRRSFLL